MLSLDVACIISVLFFFQAEDGIRYFHVTGVQTCALPILKEHDWSQYKDKHVGITCSTDAIVPTWAYMILANKLTPYAASLTFGTKEDIIRDQYNAAINAIPYESYRDERIVVKGCGDIFIPESAFVTFTSKNIQFANSITYGVLCSTVPVFKR